MLPKLREMWRARPFAPFAIHLRDGRSFEVPRPDFFHIWPNGRVLVFDETDHLHHLNPLEVGSVTESPTAQPAEP